MLLSIGTTENILLPHPLCNVEQFTLLSFSEQLHLVFTANAGGRRAEMSIPVFRKRKRRLRFAKWFSETTWWMSRELKIKLRSCLFPWHSSWEGSLAVLEQESIILVSPMAHSSWVWEENSHHFDASNWGSTKSCLDRWTPHHRLFQNTFTPSCPGPDLGGYLCLIWNLK